MHAAPIHTHPSPREETASALSHALGLVGAAAAWPAAVDLLPRQPLQLAGFAVFVLTMALVYLASTVYHALPQGRAKRWLQRADHAAIFLFIAGSFTPFALHRLDGAISLAAFAGVWALALGGIVCKARGGLVCRWRSTALYVGLGWLAAAAALPVLPVLTPQQVALLLGGGAAYMLGAVFFLMDDRLRYSHLVWHLFVLAGSGCHFAALLLLH
jgi:hemolysin III